MLSFDHMGSGRDNMFITMMIGLAIVGVLIAMSNARMMIAPGFLASARQPSLTVTGGGGVGSPAKGGEAAAGMSYLSFEGDIAAVDTITNLSAFGGSSVTVQVPQGASVLNMCDIAASFDIGAAVASVRGHVQVRLVGSGLRNSPHDFNGPAVSVQGVTSGNAMVEASKRYEGLSIGVVGGGQLQVQAVLIGEDPGDATISVGLGFVLS